MRTSLFLFFVLFGVIALLAAFLQPTLESLTNHVGCVSTRILIRTLAMSHFVGMGIILYMGAQLSWDDIRSTLGLQYATTAITLLVVGVRYVDLSTWVQRDDERKTFESKRRLRSIVEKVVRQVSRRTAP